MDPPTLLFTLRLNDSDPTGPDALLLPKTFLVDLELKGSSKIEETKSYISDVLRAIKDSKEGKKQIFTSYTGRWIVAETEENPCFKLDWGKDEDLKQVTLTLDNLSHHYHWKLKVLEPLSGEEAYYYDASYKPIFDAEGTLSNGKLIFVEKEIEEEEEEDSPSE